MKLYGLKNCDTCRKALKALPQAQLVDVRTDGVGADVLARALAQFGAALVNTRSTTWRALDAGARAQPPPGALRPLCVRSDRSAGGQCSRQPAVAAATAKRGTD
ncbi:MAG: arsenate reductase, partial [Lutimaribacter sp.]